MKKIGLLLLAAAAGLGFVGCTDSKADQPSRMSFVTVHVWSADDYYFETDTEKRVWPSDKHRVPGYVAKEGQRALIAFNILDTPVPNFDYNVALYDIADIYTSAAQVVTDEAELEALKDEPVEFRGGRLQGRWSTMVIRFWANDVSKHKFALIVNEAEPATGGDENYLDVELRHDSNGDAAQGMVYETYVSFDMIDLGSLLAEKKGIRIRCKNGYDIEYVKIDRAAVEPQTL